MALAPEDIRALAKALADELESRKPAPAPAAVTQVTSPEAALAQLYGIDRAAFFAALKKQNEARRRKKRIRT